MLRFGIIAAAAFLYAGRPTMSHCRFNMYASVLVVGWCAAWTTQIAWADPAVSRTFNGPDPVWQLWGTGTPARILADECRPGGARDNSGFERIVVAAPAGQSAVLVCTIRPIAVLDEFQIRMWVNASRPDLQLAARVTMPRSLDPQRRTAATAMVRGSIYNRPGHWQELHLAELPRLLADQVRVMRAMPGAAIDAHEAFVDAVMLVVPGDPNGVEVGTDDLAVDGVLLPPASAVHPAATRMTNSPFSQRADAASSQAAASSRGQDDSAANPSPVRLQGTTLLVDGKAFLPRVIQWNGESLQFLSACGFNVVQLPAPPTAEQSAEAERYGLWLLCSPDHPESIARMGLGRSGDRVLAWNLQDEALEVDSTYAMRWAELVREHDTVFGRPVIITPETNWAAINRAADILVVRHPCAGLLNASEFDSWLAHCPQRARPGTPLWIGIATQFDEAVRTQVSALTGVAAPPLAIDDQQIESLVRIASAHGAHGFVFQSASSLSAADEPTRRRAAILQLINRRLQFIEPWLAGGKVVDRFFSSDLAQIGVLLHVDRAGLLIPFADQNDTHAAAKEPPRSSSNDIVFTVPGIPETSQVFYLSPAAMQTLPSQRIAGGTRISLPASGDGFVVITEDPQVIQNLRQRVAREGPKTVQLERDLAVQQARLFAGTAQKLVQLGYNLDAAARESASINQQLARLDGLLTTGQIEQSHQFAAAVTQNLARSTAVQRHAIVAHADLESNPLAASVATLPALAALQRTIEPMRRGENLLLGGDFEDLAQMTKLGWQHLSNPVPNTRTSAQLSSTQPQHGAYCLELSAAEESMKQRPNISGNLVWIVSPPMPVNENQIVEITGWVRIDQPFASGDGIQILDSLGGPGLCLVVGQTSGWQPFRMIRAATAPAELRMTFSLTGVGSAKVDAVMVRTLEEPIARRLPTVPPVASSAATNTPGTPRPRSAVPQTR